MKIKKSINYGKQSVDNRDIDEVKRSLKNEFITTGPYVEKFENSLKNKFKCKYAYSCSSATSGLHLAFLSISLKKNDVILMPAINFISSYRMAELIGAKIYLVDVDEKTGQINPKNVLDCIKKNKIKKIKALVTMYLGGHVENNIDFFKLKKKYNFSLIEDACHAIGSKYNYNNKSFFIGSCKHSDICVFSFHPVKTITTGEGGAVLTNNKNIANKIRLLRSHGIIRNKKQYWDYDIKQLGFNYRLSDVNCALGFSQLKTIDKFYKERKKIFKLYKIKLKVFNQYIDFPNSKNKNNLYHLFLIGLNFKKIKKDKNSFINFLIKKGIFPQFHYKPIFKFSFYKKKSVSAFPGSIAYYNKYLSLPIYIGLKNKEQNFVIKNIINYLKINRKKNTKPQENNFN